MKTNTKKQNLHKIRSMMSAIALKAEHLLKAKQIVEIMQRYKFSIADIQTAEAEANGFDLLCVEYDIYKRVPFEEGKKLYPVGIFPYPSSNVYISLDEHEWPRKDCDETKIATREFFRDLVPLQKDLNRCLGILGKPLLEGIYYATDPAHPKDNHIVGIGKKFTNGFADDYYSDDERAKYRAVQVFKQ